MTNIQITKLKYPETIRHNVGMYLNATTDFTTPLREIENNSEDELLNGYADAVYIFNTDSWKMVVDNGRGIPIYADPEDTSRSILFDTVTTLHAGSKLGQSDEITSGVHGVGSSAVNAVSANFTVIRLIKATDIGTLPAHIESQAKEGYYYVLSFRKGIQYGEYVVPSILELPDGVISSEAISELGMCDTVTAVYLEPDLSIYQSGKAVVDTLPLKVASAGREGNFFLNGTQIPEFNFKSDIVGEDPLFLDRIVDFEFKYGKRIQFKGMFAFLKEDIFSSATSMINLIGTSNGGVHERIVHNAWAYAVQHNCDNLTPRDTRLGMILFNTAFTSFRTSFASQTKEKLVGLGMSWQDWEVKAEELGVDARDPEHYRDYWFDERDCVEQLTQYFKKLINENREYFDALIAKILAYKASIAKLSDQDFVKSKLAMGQDERQRAMTGDMAKVYEATSRDWPNRELYITEGKSASGRIIKFRDQEYQSVLPLRGKMKNSASLDITEFVESEELLALINTVGSGLGEFTDVNQARYGRIILSTDADVDGMHIRNLITSVFMVHAPEVIKSGMLYFLNPPYYKVTTGKKVEYFYYEEKHLIDFDNSKVEKRKGLGSYSEDEAKRFLVGKDRNIIQVTWPEDDAVGVEEARKLLYSPHARRQFMEDYNVFGQVDGGIKEVEGYSATGKSVSLVSFIKKNFLEYALFCAMYRSVPGVDGLKPVHRRILSGLNNVSSGKLTGTVNAIGAIQVLHPFGDESIENTLADMARVGAIDSLGDFGCRLLERIGHAAPRYTKVGMSPLKSQYYFSLINQVEKVEGEEVMEARYLPIPVPYSLVYGAFNWSPGINSRTPAFTYESLIQAYLNNDSSLLVPQYGYELYRDYSDLESLWTKGTGRLTLGMNVTRVHDGCIDIQGSGELMTPNLDWLKPYTENGRLIVQNLSANDIYIRLIKAPRVRNIDMDEVFSKCLIHFVKSRPYNIQMVHNGRVMTIGIKEWLDVTMALFTQHFENDRAETLSKLAHSVDVYTALPKVGELVMQNKTDAQIIKQLGVTDKVVNSCLGKAISMLRKSNHDEKIASLNSKIDEVKSREPVQEIMKYSEEFSKLPQG